MASAHTHVGALALSDRGVQSGDPMARGAVSKLASLGLACLTLMLVALLQGKEGPPGASAPWNAVSWNDALVTRTT